MCRFLPQLKIPDLTELHRVACQVWGQPKQSTFFIMPKNEAQKSWPEPSYPEDK